MNCPNCGNEIGNDAAFCMHCGKPVQQGSPSASQQMASGLSEVGKASVAAARELGQSTQQMAQRVGGSLSSSTSSVSIWGPFTGYGQRGRHVAWLLDGAGNQAGQLYNAVKTRFERREIPETVTVLKTLQLRGVNADPRPYFILQRRRATVALHIAQFGKDLYVSQVSYSLGPISMVRVWAFIAMAVYAVFYTPIQMASLGAIANGDVGGFFSTILLVCCGGPLFFASGLGVLFAIVFAGYRFITDRDILAPFRVTANEFDTDDLIALEKAVEQTVRDSLDEANLDRSLMPEAPQYGMRPQFGL